MGECKGLITDGKNEVKKKKERQRKKAKCEGDEDWTVQWQDTVRLNEEAKGHSRDGDNMIGSLMY